MYARLLEKPKDSCLLLGPRGTGKSTWIQHHFTGAVRYDLLNSREAIRLERSPHLLYQKLSGRLPYAPSQEELGALLETMIANELRAYLTYTKLRYKLFFWRTYDGVEVDFLCETREGFVAIEVKAGSAWQRRFNSGLNRIRKELAPSPVDLFGVYLGERPVQVDGISVLPVADFLEALWNGRVFRP